MSIFGSIGHVVDAAAGGVVDEAKKVGEAVVAPIKVPVGVVYDIATSPKDIMSDLTDGVKELLSAEAAPIPGATTLGGKVLPPVMNALDAAYRQGVSEPISTAMTMASHLDSGAGGQTHYGDLFSSEAWSHAYKIAQTQSIGQSITFAVANNKDPFEYKQPYEQTVHKDHPFVASLASGTVDFAARWELDPGMVGGKVGGAAVNANRFRTLTAADRLNLGALSETEKTKRIWHFIPSNGLKTRYDAMTGNIENGVHHPGFFDGKSAVEIHQAMPWLQENAKGVQIADLLAQTDKIIKPAEKINARRAILRIVGGDVGGQADLLNTQAHLADQIDNIASGSVTNNVTAVVVNDVHDMMARAGIPSFSLPFGSTPQAVGDVERQVKNFPELGPWLEEQQRKVDDLLGVADSSSSVPNVTGRMNRAVGRRQGQGLLRGGAANTGHDVVNSLLDNTLGAAPRRLESLYQASPSSVPVRIIHAVTAPVRGIAGLPPKIYDAFNSARPEGFVNVNDADESFKQLDAYLRKSGAPRAEGDDLMNKMAAAREPYDRRRVLEEAASKHYTWLAAKHGVNAPTAFLDELAASGVSTGRAAMQSVEARAYAAVERGADDPRVLAMKSAAEARGETAPQWETFRVDQIDENGFGVSLPFLDTQDASLVAMPDVNNLDAFFRRHTGMIRTAARHWSSDQYKFNPGAGNTATRALGHNANVLLNVQGSLSDAMMTVLNELNRTWKFTALFRAGYPQRIVGDDHMRIGAGFGSATIVNGLRDGSRNLIQNLHISRAVDRQALYELKAEHAILEHRLAGDHIFADNQAAMKRISEIEKKLPKLKSETRRRELQAEREVLMNEHPRDLAPDMQRMKENEAIQKSGSFKTPKAFIGSKGYVGLDGLYREGAYDGTWGDVMRQQVSSKQSVQRLGDTLQEGLESNFRMGGGSRTLRAADNPSVHLAAWTRAVNYQLRRSELASIIIKGGNADDVLNFLTKTPRGRELAKKFPWQGGHPESWAYNIERMVDQYLPTGKLREIAAYRDVRPAELEKARPEWADDATLRPDVHGDEVGSTVENGNLSTKMNHLFNKFYKHVGNFNDSMSRHPFFNALYQDEFGRRIEAGHAIAKRRGVAYTQGDMNKAAMASRLVAKKQVERTLFEMGSTSEMAHFLRFTSPFFGAWQEGMNRWWRIISRNPDAIRKFQLAYDAPRKLGLVIDGEGNPVAPGQPVSDDHRILLQVPWAWGGSSITKHQSSLSIGESSTNMMTQGGGVFNPGFGPFVQIPVNQLAINNPEDKSLAAIAKVVLPVGTDHSVMNMLTPPLSRGLTTLAEAKFFGHHTAQYNQNFTMIMSDKMVEWNEAHDNRAPTQEELNRLIKQADADTMKLTFLRTLGSGVLPVSVQVRSEFQPAILSIQRLFDQADKEGRSSDWVDQQFVHQWGEAYFPLMSSSSFNEAHVASTAGTVASIKKNRAVLDLVDPSLYKLVIGPEGEGAYSQTSRNFLMTHNLQPGSDQKFIASASPRDATTQQMVSQGWYDYNQFINHLNLKAQDLGLPSYLSSPQLVDAKRVGMARLAAHNGFWWQEYNSFNPAQYDATVEGLRTIASDKKLKGDPHRTDIFALQQYLTLRDAITAQLAIRGKQLGGSTSPEAQSNADLMGLFQQKVSGLVESNTYFNDYAFNGTIEHDPYLTAAVAATAAPKKQASEWVA